jgi:N-acetylneuraminate synthase/N,N'-diacetyllegionaminate synthase
MSRFHAQFEIEGKPVGEGAPVYVIAEAGVAHFGNEEKAYRLVDLAVDAKADAVKFQVFNVENLISEELKDWKERLGSRQLPLEAFRRIKDYCKQKNITFFATAHDEPSLDFLTELDVPVYKVGSGEVGNWPFLQRIARLNKPMIFSTGMYSHNQIKEALDAIAQTGAKDIALLHCVTRYPTPPEDAALGMLGYLQNNCDAIIGYSDHTKGFHIPLAAVALGARIIEKHITLDYDVPNAQDWKVSCGPTDLARFIAELRDVEAALGLKHEEPQGAEAESLIWASKSLVATKPLAAGSVLKAEDVMAKRPGTGISPAEMHKIIGRTLKEDRPQDSVLKWEHIA